jgi:probable F420-dependent oxidoreductase
MNFWQSVSFTETEQIVDIAKTAESLGYYGISFSEHLITPANIGSRYPYTEDGAVWWDPAAHWPDVWAMATAVASHTSRIHLTAGIYILPLHDPFTSAKAISTAAYLSNNRVIKGIGVGWMEEEFRLTGQDFHTRGRRTDEMLEVMAKLCTGEMVEHHGEFYDFDPIQMSPAPTQRVPVWVGGDSPAALRRAARNDGWIGGGPHPVDVLVEHMARLDAVLAAEGNTSSSYRRMSSVASALDLDTIKLLQDKGLTDYVVPPFYFQGTPTSTIEWKREQMERFAEQFIAPLGGN